MLKLHDFCNRAPALARCAPASARNRESRYSRARRSAPRSRRAATPPRHAPTPTDPRPARKPARIKATPPEPAQPLLHLRGVAMDPAIDRRMVDRNAAFRQHFLKVAIAERIATIQAHRQPDTTTQEMDPPPNHNE